MLVHPHDGMENTLDPDAFKLVPPWYAWRDGPESARSWPSAKGDIDVNRVQLKRVGLAMQTDTGVVTESDAKNGIDPRIGLPARFAGFGADFYDDSPFSNASPGPIWWDSMQAVASAVDNFSDAVKMGAFYIRRNYDSLGCLVFATGVNYDHAEGIFDKNRSLLIGSALGQGATRETYAITESIPWRDGDTSWFDAPMVKRCLNAVDVVKLADKATYCTELAEFFTDLQEIVEGRARQLSNAWPGQTSEFALAALRMVQASYQTLAYTTGTTSGTLSWLAGMVGQYQANFEDTVKLGDWEFDDDLPNWMLPSGGGAHDRARDYIRELNVHLATAYHMLPTKIETLLPGVPNSSSAVNWNEVDGLKDNSYFWSMMETGFDDLRGDMHDDRPSSRAERPDRSHAFP